MLNSDSDVKTFASKALYGFIALTVSGVLAFSVYVVRDLKEESALLTVQHRDMMREVKEIHDQVLIDTGRIGRLEQDVMKVKGEGWKYKQFSPRGEWE
jgi:hypothetical protein